MVLVINAPSPAASKNHATDQRQSCKGCLKPCTSAAIMPAAAGVGMPKIFRPARRHALHAKPRESPCAPNKEHKTPDPGKLSHLLERISPFSGQYAQSQAARQYL